MLSKQAIPYCLCVVLFASIVGCESNTSTSGSSHPSTPAEYFNEQKPGTMTPHGEFVAGSAEDVGPGRLQYETTDGSAFEASVSPNEDGGYHVDRVEKVTKSE